jgi:hypothetical protein
MRGSDFRLYFSDAAIASQSHTRGARKTINERWVTQDRRQWRLPQSMVDEVFPVAG